MGNIVNLDRVSKGYGPAGQLLESVSLGLDDADRVGVVGLNGAGKSTLLRLLTRAEEPDSGRVTHRRDLRVAALPQVLDLDPAATVRDVVVGTAWLGSGFAAEHEWAGDAGIRTVLTGLGLPGLGPDETVGTRSGGERRRVALAALLVRAADLLVLDEPTNHLDVAGVDWLARWLRERWRGALVAVTHDRWFLDEVCLRTWEVADRTVRAYEGGFAAWTLARAERERVAAATEARRQNLLRKEIAWLRRGPPARTSKPRFRIEAANALIQDVPPPRDQVALRRLATSRLGKQVYELSQVTLCGGAKVLLRDVDWHLGPGDRVAVLGANGAGKTTLLRLLAGALAPQGGRLVTGSTVRPALLAQEPGALLEADPGPRSQRVPEADRGPGRRLEADRGPGRRLEADRGPGQRVLEAVEAVARRVRVGDRELSAAQLAEVFGFGESRLWTPVQDLSGGERRRLELLLLLAGEPNVLLLDEPTNDLDTDTLAALEDLLDGWPGTLVVASHDRYFVERVTDTAYGLLGDGRLTHLPGGVVEYLARAGAAGEPSAKSGLSGASSSGAGPAGQGAAGAGPAGRGAAGAGPAGQGGAAPAAGRTDPRAARKELARLERLVNRLEQQEADLHAELAAHATDYARLSELDRKLRDVQAQRGRAEHEWLTLADSGT
ncbi:MAG TPA: ATP-binding cassette domain-containing protein [Micromonosporaceae bacterium]|nr:ATP-binding cassette domain-containing protein [Micromonosporaceae bacterium]